MAAPTRTKPTAEPKSGHTTRNVVIGALVVAALLAAWGLYSRHRTLVALRASTDQAAIPEVTLGKASAEAVFQAFVLPGTVQAYYEAPIYARTNGYVKQWYTDIGTRVKAGQLLAQLETPDVDDELRQAEANLRTAEATNTLDQITARRWQVLRQTNSVSEQDLDDRVGAARAQSAAVAAAEANVSQLRQLQDFKNVVAPFDGVVTARLTDVGALITNGTSTVLFRVADTSRLRIYTEVPEIESGSIVEGGTADLTFGEYPGRVFKAKIVRTSDALDPSTRTLMVELGIDNTDGTLLPGGYTDVHFSGKTGANYARVPVSALLFRADGLHVATVTADADGNTAKIVLKRVTIGQDYGTSLELTTGIRPGETIILDPPDSAFDGETVRIDRSSNAGAAS